MLQKDFRQIKNNAYAAANAPALCMVEDELLKKKPFVKLSLNPSQYVE
ncbi:hypothetical protein ACLK1X_00735 [Escherichia coli]